MRAALIFAVVCLLTGCSHAELSVTATIHADRPLHPVSPLSYGANIVLSGMSNEKMADLIEPFRQMGITNLRLHLNTGVEYLWEDHAPKPGTNPERATAETIESDDLYAADLAPRELQVTVGQTIELVLPNQSVSGIEVTLGR